MSSPKMIRFHHPEQGVRVGLQLDDIVYDVTPQVMSVSRWLQESVGRVSAMINHLVDQAYVSPIRYEISDLERSPRARKSRLLPPVDKQEIWASGVTYERSRIARQEESQDGGDVYARIYAAERPELFFKASAEKTVGHLDEVGIRADAQWSVPEPELALVLNPNMELVGFTLGNDMSSRDIEGANPLYLPQAKVYKRSCALGPCILLQPQADWLQTTLQITIKRGETTVFEDSISTDKIHRQMANLIDHLGRSQDYPHGVVLLTGTGIVPPNDFTLAEGDVVTISSPEIGTLENEVIVV